MEVNTRTVPERRLAVYGRDVLRPELFDFIDEAYWVTFDHLKRQGVARGRPSPETPTYLAFSEEVTDDQKSRVELCIPFEGSAYPSTEVDIRLEPEHLEAYVPVTKAGLAVPTIMEAYDTVSAWVAKHGEPTMPCREVYVADVPSAAVEDHVADVAFPFRPR